MGFLFWKGYGRSERQMKKKRGEGASVEKREEEPAWHALASAQHALQRSTGGYPLPWAGSSNPKMTVHPGQVWLLPPRKEQNACNRQSPPCGAWYCCVISLKY